MLRYAYSMYVVPWFLLAVAWPYKRIPGRIHTSPQGWRTIADKRNGGPRGVDRYPVLYFAMKAKRGNRIIQGTYQQIAEWLPGRCTEESIKNNMMRISSCWIQPPGGKSWHIVEGYQEFAEEWQITLSPEFMKATASGAPFALSDARRLARRPATLDVYLLACTVGARRTRSRLSAYNVLPRAGDRHKTLQSIRARWREVLLVCQDIGVTMSRQSCVFQRDGDDSVRLRASRRHRRGYSQPIDEPSTRHLWEPRSSPTKAKPPWTERPPWRRRERQPVIPASIKPPSRSKSGRLGSIRSLAKQTQERATILADLAKKRGS